MYQGKSREWVEKNTRAAHGSAGALRPNMLALMVSAAVAVMAIAPSAAKAQTAAAQETRLSFELQAQPLLSALRAFGRQTQLQVLFDDALVEGRQAAAVSGSLSPRDALTRLLSGTGLVAVSTQPGTFTLRPQSSANSTATLAAVTVTAQALGGGVTEGTRSYIAPGPSTTATPLALTQRETPQSVSVMTSQRMEDQGLTTIQQTLAQVPGVQANTLGTELGGASARGYSFKNYQFDGVNTFVQVLGGGAVPAATVADMAFYDLIEVLRGASGLVTGMGDPSGTINMVRKKPTAEFQGSAEVGLGSWGDKRGVIDLSGPLNEAGTVRGRLIAVGQDADSHIDNYGRKKGQIYGVIEADLTSSTRVTAGLEHERTKVKGQGSYVGFPLWFKDGSRTDLPVSFTGASRDNRLELESTKAFATLEQQLGNDWKLKLSASHARSSHREERTMLNSDSAFYDTAGNGVNLGSSRRVGDIEHSNVDLNVSGPFSLLGRQHELVLGAAYEEYDQLMQSRPDTSGLRGSPANLFTWDRTGAGVYGPVNVNSQYKMRQSSLYGAARFQVSDKLKLITGTRIVSHDYNFDESWATGSSVTNTSENGVFTPYAGAVYDINQDHAVYASYTTIYQPQSARDRNGAVLDPTEGANYEVGLKSAWLDGRLNTALALYQIRQNDVAEADPGYFVPGTIDTGASRSAKGIKTQGLDLEVFGALARDWNVSASWTYSQSKNVDGTLTNTTFARNMVKLWTTYRLPGDWNRLTLGGGVNWRSKTYSTVTPWQLNRDLYWEQKSFAVANLMARYEFSPQLSATLNVNNVFDKKYIASVSDWWNSGNYGTPRSVALNVKYRF
ncbi:TonB-dependent siderophore receptor [Acidovorax sp. CCYZU-2555]|uniref:TonB-dependent siderophore receptor n=1 Tax=Acidovorax sp. CCYZU-2555 TaxID=2835042 RepID=UPI001BCE62AD|nr:TonB-dependent siderophore receptor [Acidovorax sp. CCYZU-2555]MBS7781286.1 TonB-dependent siderophore receptor [Acidovorax sp. CCYZU-2555]